MIELATFRPLLIIPRWARMHEQEKQAPPQFMSTHPSVGLENTYQGIITNSLVELQPNGNHSRMV